MSAMEPENNPAETGSRPSAEVLLNAVEGYLEALRFGNYNGLEAHGEVVKRAVSPITTDMEVIEDLTARLSRSIYRNVETRDSRSYQQSMRREALGIVIRSYVYSGQEIDPGLIYSTISGVGVNRQWLSEAIRPSATFIHQKVVHDDQREFVKARGYEAVRQLGLTPLYGRLLMRYFDG